MDSNLFREGDKKVSHVIIPCNGLGNRIRTILGFYYLSRRINSTLMVFWELTEACPGYFLEVFKPIKGIVFISKERAGNILKAWGSFKKSQKSKSQDAKAAAKLSEEDYFPIIFKGQKSLRKIIRTYGEKGCSKVTEEDIEKLYGNLQPVMELQSKIAFFSKKHDLPNCVGIHVRRTDHVKAAVSQGKFVSDEKFRTIIDDELKSDQSVRVFLATDNAETQKKFIALYGKRVLVYTKIDDMKVNPKRATRHTSLEAAVVDLYLLASCKRRYGSGVTSSFSVMADRLASKAKLLLMRPTSKSFK